MSENKITAEVVFVILTYRNSTDLVDFLCSVRDKVECSYEVIIVNSYYDDASRKIIQEIAETYHCTFFNIDNKGYSYGNNYGIEYVEKCYEYKYLIVSNPDIIIKKFDIDKLQEEMAVYGPIIRTKTGKMQNPYRKKYSPMGERITYFAHKRKIRYLSYIYILFNKIERELFLKKFMKGKDSQKNVYALHGSFQVYTSELIKKYSPIFNENMFLFCEEDWMSYRMRKNKVPVYITKDIEVLHQEDGSVSQEKNLKTTREIQKSYVTYYNEKDKL